VAAATSVETQKQVRTKGVILNVTKILLFWIYILNGDDKVQTQKPPITKSKPIIGNFRQAMLAQLAVQY